jgi:ArsR family transcriptional regulator
MKVMPERYRPEDEGLAVQLKALGHPARLAIVEVLAARGTCVCGEIVEVMPLAQATVSQHLKVLKEAGLLHGTVDGPRSCYCLNHAALAELRRTLDRRLGALAGASPHPQLETLR